MELEKETSWQSLALMADLVTQALMVAFTAENLGKMTALDRLKNKGKVWDIGKSFFSRRLAVKGRIWTVHVCPEVLG